MDRGSRVLDHAPSRACTKHGCAFSPSTKCAILDLQPEHTNQSSGPSRAAGGRAARPSRAYAHGRAGAALGVSPGCPRYWPGSGMILVGPPRSTTIDGYPNRPERGKAGSRPRGGDLESRVSPGRSATEMSGCLVAPAVFNRRDRAPRSGKFDSRPPLPSHLLDQVEVAADPRHARELAVRCEQVVPRISASATEPPPQS